jgi:hypothetical protein
VAAKSSEFFRNLRRSACADSGVISDEGGGLGTFVTVLLG